MRSGRAPSRTSLRRLNATYDFNTLTRLVLMAHEYSIRVELQSAGLHGIKIIIHQRKREGSMYERHPTIEKAIKEFSK